MGRGLGFFATQILALTILYWPVVTGAAVFFQRDILNYWKPHVDWILKSLAAGETIGWNPGLMFGTPALADPNFQLFYPPTWVIVLFSPPTAYAVMVIGHALWGGLGLARLLCDRGEEKGAVAGALVFSLAGPFVSLANLWHHYCGAAWIPWVLWAVDRLVRTNGVSWRPLAVVLGAQGLAGSAESVMMSVFLGVVPAAFSRQTTRLAGVARAAAVAFGLCAIQWIPTAILVADSARSTFSAGTKLAWSLHPDLLYETIIPGRRPPTSMPEAGDMPGDDETRLLESIYLGAATLPFFVLGLSRHRGLAALGLVLLVAACGRHLGGGVSEILAQVLPFRYPSKLLAGVTVVWAVVAGAGVHRALTAEARHRIPMLALPLLVIGPLLLILPDPVEFDQRALRALVFGVASILLAVSPRTLASLAVPLVLMADLLPPALFIHSYCAPTVPHYRPKAVTALLEHTKNPRVFAPETGEAAVQADLRRRGQGSETAYHLAMADTLQALAIGHGIRYGYHGDFTGLGSSDAAKFQESVGEKFREDLPRFLDLGAIDAVVSHGGSNPLGTPRGDAEFPGLLSAPTRIDFWGRTPRAKVAARALAQSGTTEALQLIFSADFTPGADVVIDSPGLSNPASDPGPSAARITEDGNDRIEVEVQSTNGGWLVLRDSFRRGWRATVNGLEVPIEKADVLFRAVRVPSGRSTVSFAYSTPGLWTGALLGFLSVALILRGEVSRVLIARLGGPPKAASA